MEQFATNHYVGKPEALTVGCGFAPFDPSKSDRAQPAYTRYKALWDTGATHSVISEWLWKQFDLKPITQKWVRDANERRLCQVTLVNLRLANNIDFLGTEVTVQRLRGVQILLGMDIIGSGDFALSHQKGMMWTSFRHPTAGRKIDLKHLQLPPASQKAEPREKFPPAGHPKRDTLR